MGEKFFFLKKNDKVKYVLKFRNNFDTILAKVISSKSL